MFILSVEGPEHTIRATALTISKTREGLTFPATHAILTVNRSREGILTFARDRKTAMIWGDPGYDSGEEILIVTEIRAGWFTGPRVRSRERLEI